MATAFLLTGPPGVGKTTLLRRLLGMLALPAEGFFTAEIREGGRRMGFRIEDLGGRRAVLAAARLPADRAREGVPRVGRYRVDVAALDSVGVTALERGLAGGGLIVIDEIGKMEAYSSRFRAAVERALEAPQVVILGTILRAPHPWIDRVKAHPAVQLVPITAASREAALGPLAERVHAALIAAGPPAAAGAPRPVHRGNRP